MIGEAYDTADLTDSRIWKVGDIVSRHGDSEHVIVSFDDNPIAFTVRCVKADEPYDTDGQGTMSTPVYTVGEEEFNLIRRYSFVRRPER